jgi:hypothetical protein
VPITIEAASCVETFEAALARHGKPEIFNTDQGSHFACKLEASSLLPLSPAHWNFGPGIIRAGTPIAVVPAGTLVMTSVFAEIMQPSPMVTGPMTLAWHEIRT